MRRGAPALFVLALAAGATLLAPPMLDYRPRVDLALSGLGLGASLLAAGFVLRQTALRVLGSLALWVEIAVCLATQIAPFSTPLGSIWAPRIFWLTLALVVWAFLMRPAPWLRRGLLAFLLSTTLVCAVFWLNVPRVAVTASLTWLVTGPGGALYATENDIGALWRFDTDGTRSLIYPARALAGQPGTGWQPAGIGVELPPPTSTQIVNASSFRQPILFCGLSIDTDNRLYVVDPSRHEVRQFTSDGLLRGAWPLPPNYSPTQSCIAATRDRVYVSDANGYIHVYDHDGSRLAQWQQSPPTRGLARSVSDELFVLRDRSIALLGADGAVTREWSLPAPVQGLSAPYQSLLIRRSGEFLLTDGNRGQVRRFDAGGQELPMLGRAGNWPGQFAGPGGMPGDLVEPLGLAEDEGGHVYVSDAAFRLVQRFRADGSVDLIIAVPEVEASESASGGCVGGAC